MNMANGLLRLQGLNGLSHADWDSVVNQDDFVDRFIAQVRHNNPDTFAGSDLSSESLFRPDMVDNIVAPAIRELLEERTDVTGGISQEAAMREYMTYLELDPYGDEPLPGVLLQAMSNILETGRDIFSRTGPQARLIPV